MTQTIARQILEQVTTNKMSEDPKWCIVLTDYLKKMRSGFYTSIDVYGQKFTEYDIFDAYAFSILHVAHGVGKILSAKIVVGNQPMGDKEEEYNNACLQNLPYPFVGEFCGGNGDNDGYIEWSSEITVGNILYNGEIKEMTLPSGRVPLEVGYTKFETSFIHIASERGLARWPYNSNIITLFYLVDNNLSPNM